MTTKEFVENFYLEKLHILNSSFTTETEFKTYVSTKIQELNLDEIQNEKLKNIISNVLNDAFYAILLGLDGSGNIGNSKQEVFKIFDESENLISDCGDLEGYAYEYFHASELETENSSCDFIAELFFKSDESGGRKTYAKSGYRPQIEFNFDSYKTSGQQIYIGTNYAFPGDIVNAEITLLSSEYFEGKLQVEKGFKFYEGSSIIGTGKILKLVNKKLEKDICQSSRRLRS